MSRHVADGQPQVPVRKRHDVVPVPAHLHALGAGQIAPGRLHQRMGRQAAGQEGLLEARYRLARFKVSIAERAFSVNGADYRSGSWILPEQSGLASALADTAAQLGLDFQSVGSVPDVVSHAAPVPGTIRGITT